MCSIVIEDFPIEIILNTISYLRYRDLMVFMQTCKKIYRMCKCKYFWKNKLREDLCDMSIKGQIRDRFEIDPFEGYHFYFKQKVEKMKKVLMAKNEFPHLFLSKRDIEDLLHFGIEPDFNNPNFTLLMHVSGRCNSDLIKYLLERGANINLCNENDCQKTALVYAISAQVDHKKYWCAIEILINNGALIDPERKGMILEKDTDLNYLILKTFAVRSTK